MTFPIHHVPGLGDGMTIALNAVLHVFISHGLAIGLLTVIVLFQTLTWRGKGAYWADMGRAMLLPAVVVITSVGAITGVGIWFITGVLAPGGIGSLIHLFFWPWFIEWWAFTAEVVLLVIYFYLWRRLAQDRPGTLAAVGWLYVFVAFWSAILISGILGFMLTPDGWPWGRTFAQAYFNPTFVPQCVLRISAGLALGSLAAMGWIAWRSKAVLHVTDAQRGRALRLCGWLLLGCSAVAGLGAWLYLSNVPATYLVHWKFAVATSSLSQQDWILPVVNGVALGAVVLIGVLAVLKRPRLTGLVFIPALVLSLGLVVEFERVREFVRGPYLIPGYMYANQAPLTQQLALAQGEGTMLGEITWVKNVDPSDPRAVAPAAVAGQALFDANCGVCHTIGGINDITKRFRGRTLEGVGAIIGITESMVPFMAEFSGTDQERLTLATYLYYLANKDVRPRPQLRMEDR